MPRCSVCKHSGDDHVEDIDTFPRMVKDCPCTDYDAEIEGES